MRFLLILLTSLFLFQNCQNGNSNTDKNALLLLGLTNSGDGCNHNSTTSPHVDANKFLGSWSGTDSNGTTFSYYFQDPSVMSVLLFPDAFQYYTFAVKYQWSVDGTYLYMDPCDHTSSLVTRAYTLDMVATPPVLHLDGKSSLPYYKN